MIASVAPSLCVTESSVAAASDVVYCPPMPSQPASRFDTPANEDIPPLIPPFFSLLIFCFLLRDVRIPCSPFFGPDDSGLFVLRTTGL